MGMVANLYLHHNTERELAPEVPVSNNNLGGTFGYYEEISPNSREKRICQRRAFRKRLKISFHSSSKTIFFFSWSVSATPSQAIVKC